MSSAKRMEPLTGSHRDLPPGAREEGKTDPSENITVTIFVRNPSMQEERLAVERLSEQPPSRRTYVTREEFARRFGASSEDLAEVESFARENGLKIVHVSQAKRSVMLSGTAKQLSAAFGVELKRYAHPKGVFRGREGAIYLPAHLSSVVKAVLGLDDRPQADFHLRIAQATGGISYQPTQVGDLYDYPTLLDGSGQSVGIIELGGGYDVQDLQNYFSGLGVTMPNVVAVSVDGAANSPTGDANGPDGEVFLDVEVIGSLAPKAEIAVYFAPNTDAGFVDGVMDAIHDAQNDPSVISISWGSAESTWTAQAIASLDQALQDAALLGVTVCVAAGDGGSADGVNDGLVHVDFPASSQYSLGCGGTRLKSAGGAITSEVVWNDGPAGGATGGGVSDVFALPSWQAGAGVPPSANPNRHIGRGVPDISGDADPQTGYSVLVDGQRLTIGGTSAVAPLWTGLFALFNQSLGKRVGNVNAILYKLGDSTGDFRDIVSGNNGAYSAGPGWDACTGLGSPDGAQLLRALTST